MQYRSLGLSELIVSEIGFGAWGIGGKVDGTNSYGPTEDSISEKALEKAFFEGINFYDTSNIYGQGHSERLIGKTFKKKRNKVIIATKLGMKNFDDFINFDYQNMVNSVDQSLKRLKTDYIDLLQLHNVCTKTINKKPYIIEILNEIKKQGKTREVGISVKNPSDCLKLYSKYGINIFQLNLNLLDMRFLKIKNLKKLINSSISVIARTPFCFGYLANNYKKDYKFNKYDHRNNWPRKQHVEWIQGANKIFSELNIDQNNLNERVMTALRFCLTVPSVASVIPGMTTFREVETNIKASSLGILPKKTFLKLQKAYDELDLEFISKKT